MSFLFQDRSLYTPEFLPPTEKECIGILDDTIFLSLFRTKERKKIVEIVEEYITYWYISRGENLDIYADSLVWDVVFFYRRYVENLSPDVFDVKLEVDIPFVMQYVNRNTRKYWKALDDKSIYEVLDVRCTLPLEKRIEALQGVDLFTYDYDYSMKSIRKEIQFAIQARYRIETLSTFEDLVPRKKVSIILKPEKDTHILLFLLCRELLDLDISKKTKRNYVVSIEDKTYCNITHKQIASYMKKHINFVKVLIQILE